jgi:hypothetical protein
VVYTDEEAETLRRRIVEHWVEVDSCEPECIEGRLG